MIGDINKLPEECISHFISLTTPRDACVASAVSTLFRSGADSDTAWRSFLPPDLPSILARAAEPVECGSKKELFFRLCDDPVLIDGGRMSFGLERETGKKRFVISARSLYIVWGEDKRYWKWIPVSESRFSEAAELLDVCWLEIRGKIDSKILSPQTTYAAHMIFKLSEDTSGLQNPPQECTITINGQTVSNRSLTLQTNTNGGLRRRRGRRRGVLGGLQWFRFEQELEATAGGEATAGDGSTAGGEAPAGGGAKEREDGWMEVEMGEFRSENGEEGEVEMSLTEIEGGHWKRGLVVQGIEIRPKNN
ncbi:hypothetical protein LUZ60_006865 [Juncus effusus]|nr:hypothetical protein LUZ60_006865 [Juncus effusus]